MKVCFEYGGPNPFKGAKTASLITLEQAETRGRLFRVTYGLERKEGLRYVDAAKVLGSVLMHHLACEGHLDNDGE